jgi:hypothetical protein
METNNFREAVSTGWVEFRTYKLSNAQFVWIDPEPLALKFSMNLVEDIGCLLLSKAAWRLEKYETN